MTLFEQLTSGLKTAMKAGDSLKVGVLRMAIAALKNKEIELKRALTDVDVQEIIRKEAKKRKESIAAFTAGGRADLAAHESEELALLEPYLPKMMSEPEIIAIIDRILQSSASKDFGPLMKVVMAETKGVAEASLVSKILKSKLS